MKEASDDYTMVVQRCQTPNKYILPPYRIGTQKETQRHGGLLLHGNVYLLQDDGDHSKQKRQGKRHTLQSIACRQQCKDKYEDEEPTLHYMLQEKTTTRH
jgi:hypothetical protein